MLLKPMAQPLPVPRNHQADPARQVVVLRGVGWADYQRMLEIEDRSSALRLPRRVLEIMTPSRQHDPSSR